MDGGKFGRTVYQSLYWSISMVQFPPENQWKHAKPTWSRPARADPPYYRPKGSNAGKKCIKSTGEKEPLKSIKSRCLTTPYIPYKLRHISPVQNWNPDTWPFSALCSCSFRGWDLMIEFLGYDLWVFCLTPFKLLVTNFGEHNLLIQTI